MELFLLGEPTDMLVWKFLRHYQTECAGRALCGDLVFEVNGCEEYLDALSEFELAILPVALGPPRWLSSKPHRARERWLEMNRWYMVRAVRDLGWSMTPKPKNSREEQEGEKGWDPILGAPL